MKNQHLLMTDYFTQSRKENKAQRIQSKNEMCGAGKAERAERSGLPRFFFGYFLCSNDKESNNKNSGEESFLTTKKILKRRHKKSTGKQWFLLLSFE
jgi:hypothetical protein